MRRSEAIREMEEEFEIKEETKKLGEEETRKSVKKIYHKIIKILKKYMVMKEDEHILVSTWIIGNHFHSNFNSYPYLFFNAMKGSGKSRVLSLIANLCKGRKLASLTEAVLFRTKGMLAIDEFEGVAKKGNENLRELLNTAYKKGDKVIRMRKSKTKDGETQEVEEFEVYRPIIMANIYGMDEVLGDRCIQLTLERSNDLKVTKLQEDFEDNPEIQEILGEFVEFGELFSNFNKTSWNAYISEEPNSTNSTNSTYTTNSTNSTIYTKINKSGLFGRDLELFFPLYLVAEACDNLDRVIEISHKISTEKKERDLTESMDVQVYDFVSQIKTEETLPYSTMSTKLSEFRGFLGLEEKQDIWVNSRWLGRAFKRLNLAKEKRKVQGRTQVILDIEKAKEKIKMFRDEPEDVKTIKIDSQSVETPKNDVQKKP